MGTGAARSSRAAAKRTPQNGTEHHGASCAPGIRRRCQSSSRPRQRVGARAGLDAGFRRSRGNRGYAQACVGSELGWCFASHVNAPAPMPPKHKVPRQRCAHASLAWDDRFQIRLPLGANRTELGPRDKGLLCALLLVPGAPPAVKTSAPGALYWRWMAANSDKKFYLETFGCQMNVHDSEKVIGTLISQGYRQVSTVEDASLILYNTCSIRDKAEQKVFHRLADYKKLQAQGKKFGVLGCVAQQEGEKIFERAPHVSLVCGSDSYRKLPEMLVNLEAGKRSTGLDDRQTDECFETEFTARTNPYRGYITIIEGCDKFCAYCVVPFTRGKERSRTSESVLAEARQMADLGYSEIQLLGQNVNSYKDPEGKKTFAELLAAVGEVPGIKRVRFTTSHPRDFGRDIVQAIDAV